MSWQVLLRFLATFALAAAPYAVAQQNGPAGTPPAGPAGAVESLLKGIESSLTNIVAGKDAYLASLVDKHDLDGADRYYGNEKAYFASRSPENDPALKRLAEALNAKLVPQLERALEALRALGAQNEPARWTAIAQQLGAARADLWSYGRYHVLQLAAFRSPGYAALEGAIRQRNAQLVADAPRAFREYDHLGGASFFSLYPVPLEEAAVLSAGAATLLAQAERASAALILRLPAKYPAMDVALREELAVRYLARALRERGDRRSAFYLAYQIQDELRAAGFPAAPRGARILLVDTTQGAGASGGTAFVNDSGLPLLREDARGMSQSPGLQGADYFVALAASADAPARRIAGQAEIGSRYVTGTRSVANPALAAAKDRQAQAPPAPARENDNPVTAIGAALARLFAGDQPAEHAQAKANTPAVAPVIEEAVYADYKFKVTRVEVLRSGQLLLTVWDRKGASAARFSFPWREARSFEIAEGIHERDPARAALLARYAEPKTLEAFESGAPRVALAAALEKLMAASPPFAPYVAGQPLFEPSQRGGGAAGAATASRAAGSLDTQLASVVVVRNPGGIAGAGFYVAPFLVMTNRHLVEGAKTAELERYDGAKLQGRVLRADAALDVALLEVTSRGIPVIFQSGPILAGSAVGAVGNAGGAPFSVTRGVVEALVRVKNPLAPGAREVLAVRSDVAAGNAGGPLFVDGLLIGISTPGLAAGGGKPGAFAVHFSELARFLRE